MGAPGPIRFGSGAVARRLLVVLGWILLPVLVLLGIRAGSLLHLVTAAILGAALWPVTARSGEVLWDGRTLFVRRFLRFRAVDPGTVDAATVTQPMFRRQSLVLRLKRPLGFSRYVYCRLAPGTAGAAWSLVQGQGWEPGRR
jgi:hypothetical protein